MPDIGSIFDEVAHEIRADLAKARAALEHAGLKGCAAEEGFRSFLRQYLPKRVDIVTGTLIDAEGRTSRQLDVMIVDAFNTPVLFQASGSRVVPVECAYAVIEVRTTLHPSDLESCLRNMKSVRGLAKKAYFTPDTPIRTSHKLYGGEWPSWPTIYLIFAYESANLDAISVELSRLHEHEQLPPAERIDTICVLDEGVICNRVEDGRLDLLPTPNSALIPFRTPRPLLFFYTMLARYMNQAEMVAFRFNDYVRQLHF